MGRWFLQATVSRQKPAHLRGLKPFHLQFQLPDMKQSPRGHTCAPDTTPQPYSHPGPSHLSSPSKHFALPRFKGTKRSLTSTAVAILGGHSSSLEAAHGTSLISPRVSRHRAETPAPVCLSDCFRSSCPEREEKKACPDSPQNAFFRAFPQVTAAGALHHSPATSWPFCSRKAPEHPLLQAAEDRRQVCPAPPGCDSLWQDFATSADGYGAPPRVLPPLPLSSEG